MVVSVVKNSFIGTATELSIPSNAVMGMIRSFSYDVDFQRDIKRGDKLEVVMDKLLFEIQQMKNASRLIKTPTAESNGLKLMGEMFEDALNSNSPIKITARGIKSFTLQQLSAFVATNQQLRLITIPAEKQTDDMVRLIESLVSKNADLSVPTTRKFNG